MRFFLFIFMTGCMVGPNFKQPPQYAAASFQPSDQATTDPVVSKWWEEFHDPLLTSLIEDAACYNFDVRMASQNICLARANRMIATAPLLPQVDVDVSYDRNTFGGALAAGGGLDEKSTLFFWGFDALWEIDLFGRRRRERRAATQRIFSAIEERNHVLISVFAEVAVNYFDARGYQQRISNFEKWIQALNEKLALVKERVAFGLDPELNQEAMESTLLQIQSEIPVLQANYFKAVYRLSFLTGGLPDRLIDAMQEACPLPYPPESVACGLPCELLRRRPDIRQKEREYHASLEELGAREAEQFPTIVLSGNIGRQTFTFSMINQENKFVWGYAANLLSPVFHGGEIQGKICAASAQKNEAYYDYYKTCYLALEEAESALSRYSEERIKENDLSLALEHQRKVASFSQERYSAGMDSFIDYLDQEINYLTLSDQEIASKTKTLANLIALYKALGGL